MGLCEKAIYGYPGCFDMCDKIKMLRLVGLKPC